MTSTDRAFIAALQQQSARGPATGTPVVGPHFAPAAKPASLGAVPLSHHLARRRTGADPAPAATADGPFTPGLEIDAFMWPPVAQQLAHAGRDALVDLLSSLAHRVPESAPKVAVVGASPGAGATTLLLALARVAGSVGASAAIVDLTGASGAAAQLGVRRRHGMATSIDDSAVASREDQLTLLALGAAPPASLVEKAVARLTASHELVLIDIDLVTAVKIAGAGVQVILAAATSGNGAAIVAAQQTLASLDVVGVVETLGPFV